MRTAFNELTIRISNGSQLVDNPHLSAINEALAGLGIPRGRLIWCLYGDYLVFGMGANQRDPGYVNFSRDFKNHEFEKFIARLQVLLKDYEVTMWLMLGQSDETTHYHTYFSNYNTKKIIHRHSDREYLFGDYK